jgi:hypothetical protein
MTEYLDKLVRLPPNLGLPYTLSRHYHLGQTFMSAVEFVKKEKQPTNIASAVTALAAVAFFSCSTIPAVAQGLAEENAIQLQHEQVPVLKGQVDYCVPIGTPLKLKIASVPTNGLELLDRDLDGNLLPARLGEVITARLSEDMFVDDNKVIPEGTVFYGKVSKILPPRRLSRPGSLVISFEHLVTPDGRKFAFHAEADNSHASTNRTKAKGFGKIAANAAGGAAVGVMVAYQLTGLHTTISTHGLNLAAGAAGGALLATGYAIMHKGHAATMEPGEDLNLALDTDLLMPAAVEANAKPQTANNLEGLDIQVKKTKLLKDGLDGHLMQVDVKIVNNSTKTLKSIDLYLEDTNGNRNAICSGPDIEQEYIFAVEPRSHRDMRLYFQVQWPKLKQSLVWLNHQSRQVAYRGSTL